jgi:hypothetical protein
MSKGNGQANVSLEDQLKDEQLKDTRLQDEQTQTLEKELPAADPADGFAEKSVSGNDSQSSAATTGGEVEKLRARCCRSSIALLWPSRMLLPSRKTCAKAWS